MFKNLVKTTTKVVKNTSFKNPSYKSVIFSNNKFQKNYAKKSGEKKNAAVILSGCGYLDGSEVTEAVSCIVQLQKQGYNVECFAPNYQQEQTYDHLTTQVESNEIRNVEAEATRITRKMSQWKKLKADAFNLLVIPGGNGITKNLSSYSADGINFTVKEEIKEQILAFHEKKKPIAMLCIAPILAANIFGTKNGGKGCKITLGDDASLNDSIATGLGVTVEKKTVNEVCIDHDNNLISSPAYMDMKADPLSVFEAAGKVISAVSKLSGVMEAAGLSKEQLKAIDGLCDDPNSEEQKKWWIEKIQKGDAGDKMPSYKSTINDPENWVQKDF